MQIHELTKKKKVELEEGIADTLGGAVGKTISGAKNVGNAIASPFKDVAGGYKDARMDQKVSAMADKAYRSWKSYEAQLLKATPNAKESGELKQALLAFVNKNLLGGMYLPNVINKDKITGLVDQIAGGGQSTAAASNTPPSKHTGGKVAGQLSQTPGAVAKRNARAQTTQANTAGAGAFGQMTNQLGGTKPNTMANAPVSKTNIAKPNNYDEVTGAITPAGQAKTAADAAAEAERMKNPKYAALAAKMDAIPGPGTQTNTPSTKPATTFGKVPSTTAPVKVAGATKAGAPTPAEYEKLQQKIAAASNKPSVNEAIPTVKPTVRPVGGLAARSAQRNAPATSPTAPVAPATTAPATPAQAPAAQPAAASANEKELFKQLVQQAALAQTSAPGAGAGTAGQPNAKDGKGQASGAQDARGMAQALRQQLDPAIVKSLPALSATASQLTGSRQVSSTGNPAADGLLVLMGFQGL